MSAARNRRQAAPSKRIVFLGPHDCVGGAVPRIIGELSAGLKGHGWIVSSSRWGARSGSEGLVRKLMSRTNDAFRISNEVAAERPDMVVIHTGMDWKTVVRDLLLCSRLRRHVPIIILQPHGGHAEWLGRGRMSLFRALSTHLLKLVDGVFVLSWEEAVHYAAAVPGILVQRIDNPFHSEIDLRDVEAPVECERLVFVGRLVATKGIMDTIEAMTALQANVSLAIAGDGPLLSDARRIVDERGLSDRVCFHGRLDREELTRLYANSDVLILPTYWAEGFPTVLAEAMAAGLAIVTTPVRGARDYLVDGDNCVFVPPRSPHEIARAVQLLQSDRDLARRMGENNRSAVLQFLPEQAVRRYQAALLEVRQSVV